MPKRKNSNAGTPTPKKVKVGNGSYDPINPLVNPMLTDLYQITMAYAYWKSGTHEADAVFDLFFRKNPFKGQYAVFGGLDEVLRHVHAFRFTPDHVSYLREQMPECDEGFFEWLAAVDCSKVKVYAVREGDVVFPRIPLIRIEGPLAVSQLLETTLLCLVNYATLVATNARRMVQAAGPGKTMLEFGLRRAQGPDGAMAASRNSVLGGFHGTSNVLAGFTYDIKISGTHAHAFVSSFTSVEQLRTPNLMDKAGKKEHPFVSLVLQYREELAPHANDGETAAFIAYAQAYPNKFLALVDTYDTLHSGVPNYCAVSLALRDLGYTPVGIRLDSGDLSALSKGARAMFRDVEEKYNFPGFSKSKIAASNDINEATLLMLAEQGHEIDIFGVGTNLVTCQAQPALGGVFKLVEVNGVPRIKLSEDIGKVTIPGRKNVYRLSSKDGTPICDYMTLAHEPAPQAGDVIYCRHPFKETMRVNVKPTTVTPLLQLVWDGKLNYDVPTLMELREFCGKQVASFKPSLIQSKDAKPYKVSVSADLYTYTHDLWQKEASIKELE